MKQEVMQLEFPTNLTLIGLNEEIKYLIGLLTFPIKEGIGFRTVKRTTLKRRIGTDYPKVINNLVDNNIIQLTILNETKIQYCLTDQLFNRLNYEVTKFGNVLVGDLNGEYEMVIIPNYYD